MGFSRYVNQPKPRYDGVPSQPAPSTPSNSMTLGQAEFGVGGAASGRGFRGSTQGGYADAMKQRNIDAAIDAGSLRNYQPWRNAVNIAGTNVNFDQPIEQIAADIANIFYNGGYDAGGGGGGSSNAAYTAALRDMVANAGAGAIDYAAMRGDAESRYGGYGTKLSGIAEDAIRRQQEAAEVARQRMSELMPSTVVNVTPADIGLGSAANYLASIGASADDVRAVKAFEDAALARELKRTRDFSQRVGGVEQANRAEQQRAIETILQSGLTGVETTRSGYQSGLEAALAAEMERLFGLEGQQRAAIQDRIDQARLAGAEIGVIV